MLCGLGMWQLAEGLIRQPAAMLMEIIDPRRHSLEEPGVIVDFKTARFTKQAHISGEAFITDVQHPVRSEGGGNYRLKCAILLKLNVMLQ